jgi:hypothetical protein
MKNAILQPTFNQFLANHNNSVAAQDFIEDISTQTSEHCLFFQTDEDLEFLFKHPDFYQAYKQYLIQNPEASEEDKMTALRFVVEAPKNPIHDLSQKLNCFDIVNNQNTAQFQSISLYVDQPIANSNKLIDDRSGPIQKANVGAGHTWLSITQVINGQTTTLNVGLYPAVSSMSLFSQPGAGAFNNDSNHAYDVFVRWENLSDQTFDAIITNLKAYTSAPNYDLNDFNCTTWAVKELEKVGLDVPQTIVDFGYGNSSGLCPAQLGQDLRTNQPANTYLGTQGGTGPTTTCQ